MRKNHNVFVAFLDLLNVRHTVAFSEKLFEEHPNKNNLLGLSQMLSDYNIENTGVRIKDKTEFNFWDLDAPFVAQISHDFVTVYKITAEKISYLWNGTKVTVNHGDFKDKWSGVLLLAEADEKSIEPNYLENRKKTFADSIKKYLLLISIAATFIFAFISNRIYNSWGLVTLAIINLTGIYTCYLLALKQLHIQSSYADKLCSLFKQSHCNSILESKAAKIGGIIGWGEIGLGYFISNLILIAAFPNLIPYLFIINLVALPYTIWSVWYQKFKAKQWCPLCLMVQCLLWLIFIAVLTFGYIQIPSFAINEMTITGLVYIIPILTISTIIQLIAESKKGVRVTQEINSLKTSEEIFSALLKNQPYHKIEFSDSQIVFGNPDAKTLITIFSNPHCNPCTKMHKRVDKLLSDLGDRICIQYIFSSFTKELESSAKYLIALYLNNDIKAAESAYNEWFGGGMNDSEAFFRKYGQDIDAIAVNDEFARHTSWNSLHNLNGTPTVLVNGYILPDIYKIEDMKFFTDLDLDLDLL